MQTERKLFPAIWKNRTHFPLIRWKDNATADLSIHASWLNAEPDHMADYAQDMLNRNAFTKEDIYLCIATVQSNITVIDIDNKNGKNGSASLAALELDYDDLPETLKVSTPSGGYHLLFEGQCAVTVGKLGRGIDTPVMVPVPGSTVRGKGEYTVIHEAALAPLPSWIPDKLGEPNEQDPEHHIPAVDEDQPHNVSQAALFLQTAAPALEGEGGDDHTFKTACRVRDFAISMSTCLDLMLQIWNPRCQPPWGVDELEKKIKNAYNYAATKAGENLAEADFTSVIPYDGDGPKHISEFQGPPPERRWLLPEWIPEGEITSLYGAGGVGKSLLAYQLGLAISGGGEFLGMKIDNPLPTLAVFCEDSDNELHIRFADIRNSAEYAFIDYKQDMFVWSRAGSTAILARADRNKIIPGAFYKMLEHALKGMGKGPKFLILDTLADMFAGSENDRAMVNYFVKVVLGGLIKDHEATILLLGHPAKATDSEYSGSTAWNNAVRTRITLSPHENENLPGHRILERSKSNYALKGEQLWLQWVKGCFMLVSPDEVVDDIMEADLRTMLDLITKQAGKKTPVGLHNACGLPLGNVIIEGAGGKVLSMETKKMLVARLTQDGLVKNIKGGKHGGSGLYPAEVIG